MNIDASSFKQVMRRFPTGVMVLTVPDGEGMHAATVNAVTSVSLDPPLMLVCIEKNARSHELVHFAGRFALNILAERQQALGERFAFDREARGRPADFGDGVTGSVGALLFSDSLGFLECRVAEEYPGGDHTIFLARVVNLGLNEDGPPLLYYMSQFTRLV